MFVIVILYLGLGRALTLGQVVLYSRRALIFE